jgi:hypothetical protein
VYLFSVVYGRIAQVGPDKYCTSVCWELLIAITNSLECIFAKKTIFAKEKIMSMLKEKKQSFMTYVVRFLRKLSQSDGQPKKMGGNHH